MMCRDVSDLERRKRKERERERVNDGRKERKGNRRDERAVFGILI